jgi:hypothetical protein
MLNNQNIIELEEQKRNEEYIDFEISEDDEEPIIYSRLSKDRIKINENDKTKTIIDINDETNQEGHNDDDNESITNLNDEDDFGYFLCYYSWHTCCTYFLSLIGFILFLGLFAGIISYYVFGIKFLIEYEYEHNVKEYKTNPCGRDLWIYVLIMLILPILNVVIIPPICKPSMKSLTPIFLLLRSLLLISLGVFGIVLYSNCNAINNTELYIWTKIVSIFTLTIGIISFLMGILLGYVQRILL